ncbi:MAG: hypothetical protein MK165_01590 [Pirellulaceae bacterium]|nr:hypothetical protein [Pirellulaceae bacterium]
MLRLLFGKSPYGRDRLQAIAIRRDGRIDLNEGFRQPFGLWIPFMGWITFCRTDFWQDTDEASRISHIASSHDRR